MGQIYKAIVLVLVRLAGGGEVAVVNPDILRKLDGDCVTVGCFDETNSHVADDDVALTQHREANAREGWMYC